MKRPPHQVASIASLITTVADIARDERMANAQKLREIEELEAEAIAKIKEYTAHYTNIINSRRD